MHTKQRLHGSKAAVSKFFSKQADISDHAAMWSPLVSQISRGATGHAPPVGVLPGLAAMADAPEGESKLLHGGLGGLGAEAGFQGGRYRGSWLGAILGGSLGLGANHALAMLGSALNRPSLMNASKSVGDAIKPMIRHGSMFGETLGGSFGAMGGKRLGQRGASDITKHFKGKPEQKDEYTIQPAEPWQQRKTEKTKDKEPSANSKSSVSVKGMGREEKPMHKKEEEKDDAK